MKQPSAPQPWTFPGAQGHTLSGRLELPPGPVRATALFAHCFTCGSNQSAATRISRALTAHGFAVLRFDFTGLGNSEGDFANTNFSTNVADLVAAAEALGQRLSPPELLIGHSLGGAAVIAAAAELSSVKAVATLGAPADPGHVEHLLGSTVPEIERTGQATVQLGPRQFQVQRHFLEDIRQARLTHYLKAARHALLVLHSPVDELVGIEQARGLFDAARHPKSFVALDGADHLLTKKSDALFAADILAAWAERYLSPASPGRAPAAQPGAATEPLPPERVSVREQGNHLAQSVSQGPHVWSAGEPESVGGDDGGPTPYALLLSSLGACTSMTLRLYARRKGIPLEGVEVRLQHSRVHRTDSEEALASGRAERVDRIALEIHLRGSLSPEQRERLLAIAHRCPIHRTLQSAPLIELELAP